MFWRILCVLLLLGNGIFYAWSQGYFGRLNDGREPQRQGHQLDADKLQVRPMTAEELAAPAPAAARACLRSSPLPLSEAEALLAQLQELARPAAGADTPASTDAATDQVSMSLQALAPTARQWVHIPPLENRALMEKKLQELKQLGISDVDPRLEAGSDRFAIGLGLFDDPERAQAHLQQLNRRGVRSAIISPRERPAQQAQVVLHGPTAALSAHLASLMSAAAAASTTPPPFTDCPVEP